MPAIRIVSKYSKENPVKWYFKKYSRQPHAANSLFFAQGEGNKSKSIQATPEKPLKIITLNVIPM